jgi:hypothetical protein
MGMDINYIGRMHDDLVKLQELSARQTELLGRILETARNGLKILEGGGIANSSSQNGAVRTEEKRK